MDDQEPTDVFLYRNYAWPEPGTRRHCPFSGIPLQLNEPHPGYNGKPWTCPRCVWYFSEEDLQHPENFKGQNSPYTLQHSSAETPEL